MAIIIGIGIILLLIIILGSASDSSTSSSKPFDDASDRIPVRPHLRKGKPVRGHTRRKRRK